MRVKCLLLGFLACGMAWTGLAEGGEGTPYSLPSDGDKTENGRKVSVYFNQKAYTISRYSSDAWSYSRKGDFIGCARYDANSADGHLSKFTRMRWVSNPTVEGDDKNLSGQDVAATVYNGRIYVFYDVVNTANWDERLIYYKSSDNPENSWAPTGGLRIREAYPVKTGFGLYSSMLTLAAAVLDGKLYVFYSHIKGDKINSVVYDGKTWTAGPSSSDGFKCLSAKTIITDTGKSLIALACVDESKCFIRTFDGTNYYKNNHGIENPKSYVRLSYGSVSTGADRNVLQIFITKFPQRIEYTLPGDTATDGSFSNSSSIFDTRFEQTGGYWCPVDSYLSDEKKNLQQYVTIVFDMNPGGTDMTVGVTYESDYFKFLSESDINTAESGNLPSAWSIIGVIEGVPPFATNNVPGAQGTSTVKYGQSDTKTVSTTSTYAPSFTVGVAGAVKGVFSGGLSFTQGFKNVHDYSTEIVKSVNFTFSNKDANADGSKGFLLINKPTLTVRNYTQCASDKVTQLNAINFTDVASVNLDCEEYDLDSPRLLGMKARPKSSNYKGWYKKSPANVNSYQDINSITASTGGVSSESGINIKKNNDIERSSSSTVKVETSFFDVFKTSGEFKFEVSSKNKTSLGQNITVSLSLPAPPAGQTAAVNRIVVKPYWLVPKFQPYWIPTDYKYNEPWCLTWSVLECSPDLSKGKDTSFDVNGDGKQDVLSFKKFSSSSSSGRNALAGVLDGSIYLVSDGKTLEEYDLPVNGSQYSLVGAGEFCANDQTGLVWFDATYGQLSISLTQDSQVGQAQALQGLELDSDDAFADCGEFQPDDGCDELLIRDPDTGMLVVYGVDIVDYCVSGPDVIFAPGDAAWKYLNKGDFDGNGCWDALVWNQNTGAFKIVYLKARGTDDSIVKAVVTVFDNLPAGKTTYSGLSLTPLGSGDFDGDGVSDVLFRDNVSKRLLVALLSADGVKGSGYIRGLSKLAKRQEVAEIGDFDGDGVSDLLLATPSANGKRVPVLAIKYLGARAVTDASPVKVRRGGWLSLGQSYLKAVGSEIFESLD